MRFPRPASQENELSGLPLRAIKAEVVDCCFATSFQPNDVCVLVLVENIDIIPLAT